MLDRILSFLVTNISKPNKVILSQVQNIIVQILQPKLELEVLKENVQLGFSSAKPNTSSVISASTIFVKFHNIESHLRNAAQRFNHFYFISNSNLPVLTLFI